MKIKQNFQFLLLLGLLSCSPAGGLAAADIPPVQAWARHFDLPGGDSLDTASQVAVDSQGNVIVAGETDRGRTGKDWMILKYSSQGIPLWTNYYNGPANGDDTVSALAIDGGDNILVAGSSPAAAETGLDFLLMKYSSSGAGIWTNRHDGVDHLDDTVTGLAPATNGDFYLLGTSTVVDLINGELASHAVFITMKYSGAGLPIWTNQFSGEPPGPDEVPWTVPAGIATDGANVYVVGYTGTLGNPDYTVLAYASSGAVLWTNLLNRAVPSSGFAAAVTTDGAGRVLVTGRDDYSGYLTAAYAADGTLLWTNRFNVPGGEYPFSSSIAVGADGRIFVTGAATGTTNAIMATIALSDLGALMWTNYYAVSGIGFPFNCLVTLDAQENVFVSGSATCTNGFPKYATLKYSSQGAALWTNTFTGTNPGDKIVCGLAVDAAGDVVVAGTAYVGSTDNQTGLPSDWAVIKYTGAGAGLWTNLYNGVGHPDTCAVAVVADSAGNAIVTGLITNLAGNTAVVTIKYSSAGTPQWTNCYTGAGVGPAQVSALALDSQDNIFLAGSAYGAGGYPEVITLAYAGTGAPLWTNRFASPGTAPGWRPDKGMALAVDAGDAVVMTAQALQSNSTSPEFVTIKYSGSGIPQWTNYFIASQISYAVPFALAIDADGTVIVTGESYSHVTANKDLETVAYSSQGVALWTNGYNKSGVIVDSAVGVAVDSQGRVFVTGNSGDGFSHNFVTLGYANHGTAMWTNTYRQSSNEAISAAVAVDNLGGVYVTGSAYGGGIFIKSRGIATVKYSDAGVPLWTNRFEAESTQSPRTASAIKVDSSGNILVAGWTIHTTTSAQGDPLARSYDWVVLAITPSGQNLWTNYFDGIGGGTDRLAGKQSLALGRPGSIYLAGVSDCNPGVNAAYALAAVKYVLPPVINTADGLFGFNGSAFGFNVSNIADTGFVIEASANLLDWVALQTNSSGDSSRYFSDPQPGSQPARFYRVRLP